MKSIALVILNYNGIELLKKFIDIVISNSPQADVVLVDNCSTDESVDWFKSSYPELQCIELDQNYGYAGGYNEGLKQVKHPYYALLNSDLCVTENWLIPLLELFSKEKEIAILQPHILDYKKKDHFEYAGAAGGYIDQYGIPFCRGRILNTLEKDVGQYDRITDVFWASGACFLIRNEVFWKLGGFDSDFFAHQEEIDLCWRAYNTGYRVCSVGESKVYHIGGGTLAPSSKKVYLNHRNSLYMLTKNIPDNIRNKILFKKLLLDGLIGINYMLTLNFSNTWAILKAHFAFYKNYPKMLAKSHGASKRRNYFYKKSILMDYFVRKVRFFGQLEQKI